MDNETYIPQYNSANNNARSPLNIVDNKNLLMVSLAKFFSDQTNIVKVMSIISGDSNISLRLIDWFVTNFSKKNGTIIVDNHAKNVTHFNVYMSYRSQLKAYSKQQFDPFRRRDRITFYYERDKFTETTIGQLNFFRWVLENKILDYMEHHHNIIESDMITAQKENSTRKQGSEQNKSKQCMQLNNKDVVTLSSQQRKKRNELSRSFIKNMNKFGGIRTISFD